jgi:predicted PurR-regulated permease PerM
MPVPRARILAAALMVLLIIGIVVVGVMTLSKFLGNHDNISGLASKVASILTDAREELPASLEAYIPDSVLALKESVADFIKEHGKEIGTLGKESLHSFAHILIALAIALMLAIQTFQPISEAKPLAAAMRKRLGLLIKAFENVVFAQMKISAINTTLTAIFLFAVLPMMGVDLPYSKTLVIVTFVTGLVPVVGNLISNTLIVLIGLGVSFKVAMTCLIFLVAVHKLEYFINAKIVGSKVNAAAWELLLSMLLMESLFGVFGLLVAPIIYAYLKSELTQAELI